MAKSQNQKS